MVRKKAMAVVFLIVILLISGLFNCRVSRPKRSAILLYNDSGEDTTLFQLQESIYFDAESLEPRAGYDLQIRGSDGGLISELGLSSDAQGRIPQTLIWYNIGVTPCRRSASESSPPPEPSMIDYRDFSYAGLSYTLNVLSDGKVVHEKEFKIVASLEKEGLYASDSWGCPSSGFIAGEEDVWVMGRGFPAGSLIRLWVVPARDDWQGGEQLKDQTGLYGNQIPTFFQLGSKETTFMKMLWPRKLTKLGSYDIVAQVIIPKTGNPQPTSAIKEYQVIANRINSGFVIQRRPKIKEPLEVDIAGSRQSPFTFRNTFLTTENVYVGVDPVLQSKYVGKTAKVYIVEDKDAVEWEKYLKKTNKDKLKDVTGKPETITVAGICGNCWKTLAWSAPLKPGKYDVILDFGLDDVYDKDADLIDGLGEVGFVVASVRVNTISFNYSGSGAITVRDNRTKSFIKAPEYHSANHVVKAAAWTMGGTHKVQVEFKADAAIKKVQIWAESGLGGLNTSGSPITVNFPQGTAIFTVNSPPAYIGKHEFSWDWKYQNVNGGSTPPEYMGETGDHLLYTVYANPQAPMATPWVEVLDYAAKWASGATTESGAVQKILEGLYNSGMIYNGATHHTKPSYKTFYLNKLFNELRNKKPKDIQLDCRDCANFFHVLTNSLGFSHKYLVIDRTTKPYYFTYKNLLPMGVGWTSPPPCKNSSWSFHQVLWCGSKIADASTKLNCGSSYSSLVTAVCNLSEKDYINYLTNTQDVKGIKTGICSPVE